MAPVPTKADLIAVLKYTQRKLAEADINSTDDAVKADIARLKREETDLKECILDMAINGEDVKPTVVGDHGQMNAKTMQQHLLMNFISNLSFTASNEESINNFLTKLEAIASSVPLIPFPEILASIKPVLPASVIKSLAGKTIVSHEDLKRHLLVLYGSSVSIYQRVESWMCKQKPSGKSWTKHCSDISGSLESIKMSYATLLRRRDESARSREQREAQPFAITYDDGFEMILFLKLLQDIAAADQSLHRTVSVELDAIKTPLCLASRAEQVKCQTLPLSAFTKAHAKPKQPQKQQAEQDKSDKPATKGKGKKGKQNENQKKGFQHKEKSSFKQTVAGGSNFANGNSQVTFALRDADQTDYDSVEEFASKN
ncbi:unnamed protein product [Oikopleura dioica]|uniref:Uncharacterized protein n=1 Tax=Oikopleura dioica TaxID=34765 RepID=E4YXP2_OIKDI|nr:unnamed protein product [Oikopleura dioica]